MLKFILKGIIIGIDDNQFISEEVSKKISQFTTFKEILKIWLVVTSDKLEAKQKRNTELLKKMKNEKKIEKIKKRQKTQE